MQDRGETALVVDEQGGEELYGPDPAFIPPRRTGLMLFQVALVDTRSREKHIAKQSVEYLLDSLDLDAMCLQYRGGFQQLLKRHVAVH
jgi:hypothetical protein